MEYFSRVFGYKDMGPKEVLISCTTEPQDKLREGLGVMPKGPGTQEVTECGASGVTGAWEGTEHKRPKDLRTQRGAE